MWLWPVVEVLQCRIAVQKGNKPQWSVIIKLQTDRRERERALVRAADDFPSRRPMANWWSPDRVTWSYVCYISASGPPTSPPLARRKMEEKTEAECGSCWHSDEKKANSIHGRTQSEVCCGCYWLGWIRKRRRKREASTRVRVDATLECSVIQVETMVEMMI